MRVVRIILSLVALLSFAECTKFSSECEFIIKPRLMVLDSSNPGNPAYMARAYAFYNIGKTRSEAEQWAPESFSEAQAGLITNKGSKDKRTYNLAGEQGDDTFVHLTLTSSPVMLVVVDPISRFYAYGVFEYKVPMPRMEIVVHFKEWLSEKPYQEVYWTVVSEKYELEGPPETEEGAQ